MWWYLRKSWVKVLSISVQVADKSFSWSRSYLGQFQSGNDRWLSVALSSASPLALSVVCQLSSPQRKEKKLRAKAGRLTFWAEKKKSFLLLAMPRCKIHHSYRQSKIRRTLDLHHNVWKLLEISHLNFSILAFSTNFCPVKIDLSGNTVWPQASGFQKLAKMDNFLSFVARFPRNV